MDDEQSPIMQAMIAEYVSIRDEIIHIEGIEFQILTLALPIAGALVAYGYQQQSPVPILIAGAVLTALIFGRNITNANYLKLSAYLSTVLEPKVPGLQ